MPARYSGMVFTKSLAADIAVNLREPFGSLAGFEPDRDGAQCPLSVGPAHKLSRLARSDQTSACPAAPVQVEIKLP
ncbi:hypothetical protein ACIP1U_31630 [Cupriavidus sp. NPDC089707]|uniref:hypothetical protein n=1 Tax=Cupriavidus sp. NPDC089707 TaxID=3363963 RepID=UPI0037F4DEB3